METSTVSLKKAPPVGSGGHNRLISPHCRPRRHVYRFCSFPFDRRGGEHCLHRALEVAAVVDGPSVVERHRLVRCITANASLRYLAGSAWKSPPSASAMASAIRSTMFTA